MGNHQSGETGSTAATESAEQLPRILGRTQPPLDVESAKSAAASDADLPHDMPLADDDDDSDCKILLGPHLFTMSVPFLLVLAVSVLMPVPEHWEISFVFLKLGLCL